MLEYYQNLKRRVIAPDKTDEGKSEVDALVDKDGKHPETISWGQYVGVKESLGKKLDTEKAKVTSLEEQLVKAVKPEDHKKIVDELTQVKADHQKAVNELKVIKESSASEKRNILKQKGVPEEEVKKMSEAELNAAVIVVGFVKPKLDLGTGGGGVGKPEGSPMELARQAYTK